MEKSNFQVEIPRRNKLLRRNDNNQKGFTLVELSIALVIIGLLIGGILVGQSLLNSSKVTRTASQIQQFDAAVMGFKTKYKYLPGDSPFHGSISGQGNGDGMVATLVNNLTAFYGEIGNFWADLYPGQYKRHVWAAPGFPALTSGANKTVPESKLGNAGAFFMASAISVDGLFISSTDRRNFYAILSPTHCKTINANGFYRMAATNATNSAVTPTMLLALDGKIDDGLANSGSVISGSIPLAYDVGGAIIATPATGTCSSDSVYTVANTNYECTPLIQIGAQAGNPL